MQGSATLGTFEVITTINQGHSVEFYAERITDKLVAVADTAPPAIRAQALAFKEQVRAVIYDGLRRSRMSDRTTLIALLRQHGMQDAATLIRETGV